MTLMPCPYDRDRDRFPFRYGVGTPPGRAVSSLSPVGSRSARSPTRPDRTFRSYAAQGAPYTADGVPPVGGGVLFTLGSCGRCHGVTTSPCRTAEVRLRDRSVRPGWFATTVQEYDMESVSAVFSRHGPGAVRRRPPDLDRGASPAPRAGGARCEPRRLHRTHDPLRRSFPRPRRVVLHARLIPAPGRAAPGPTGCPADTATTSEKTLAKPPRGADPAVRAAGMAEVGLPFEWPLRAFAV